MSAPAASAPKPLQCEMNPACKGEVTHLDDRGFIYCSPHGLQRRARCRCRKLTAAELKKLCAGQQIARY